MWAMPKTIDLFRFKFGSFFFEIPRDPFVTKVLFLIYTEQIEKTCEWWEKKKKKERVIGK